MNRVVLGGATGTSVTGLREKELKYDALRAGVTAGRATVSIGKEYGRPSDMNEVLAL